jgi:hypothetical protein
VDSPLAAHRFRVEIGDLEVAVGEVAGLGFTPGEKPVATVTLRRAAGRDRTLLDWALKPTARTVVVSLLSAAGDPAVGYVLADSRPVVWRGPVLSAASAEVAMEELVLAVDRVDLR